MKGVAKEGSLVCLCYYTFKVYKEAEREQREGLLLRHAVYTYAILR